MSSSQQILLIGAGELGKAFLTHLAALQDTHITIGVRSVSKYTQLAAPNVTLLALDISGPSQELSQTFANFDIVISATGFGQDLGTVTKLANEVLEAGRLRNRDGKGRLWYFPWQFGVDYDVTGDGEGLMPLFGEQLGVRKLLRAEAAQSNVKWTIISTGVFMSFLFEQWWGVVDRSQPSNITVRALRNWDFKVTVTDVDDIGKVLARVVTGDVEAENRVVYTAGDTISYSRLADVVEQVAGKKIDREEWTVDYLEKELAKDPENELKKYRLVFARDGVWWDKEKTVNHELGIPVMDVETYVKRTW
jgi:hypothetical protein